MIQVGDRVIVKELMMTNYLDVENDPKPKKPTYGGECTVEAIIPYQNKRWVSFKENKGWAWEDKCVGVKKELRRIENKVAEIRAVKAAPPTVKVGYAPRTLDLS